jgi:hypothetical protein
LDWQQRTKGEVEGVDGVEKIGQQQGFTSWQNKGTPQNKIHFLHVTEHPEQHIKKHPFHYIYEKIDKPVRAIAVLGQPFFSVTYKVILLSFYKIMGYTIIQMFNREDFLNGIICTRFLVSLACNRHY